MFPIVCFIVHDERCRKFRLRKVSVNLLQSLHEVADYKRHFSKSIFARRDYGKTLEIVLKKNIFHTETLNSNLFLI